jgi:hypothetical protein
MTKVAPYITIAEANFMKRNGTTMSDEAHDWVHHPVGETDAQTTQRSHSQDSSEPSNVQPYHNVSASPFHPMVWFQPHPPPVPFHHSFTFPPQPPSSDHYERQTTIRHMNTSNQSSSNSYYNARPNPPQSNGRTMNTRPTRPMRAPPPPIVTSQEDSDADLYAALLYSTGGGGATNYGSTAFTANNSTGKRPPSNGQSPRSASYKQPPMNTATSRGYHSKPPSRNNSYKNLGALDAPPPPTTPPALSSKQMQPGKAPTHRRSSSDGGAAPVPRMVIPRSRTPRAMVAAANKQLRSAKPDVRLPSVLNNGPNRRLSGSAVPSPRRLPLGSSSSVEATSKPGHRRVSSGMSHYSAASYAGTEASMMSFVSDIRQSAFFGGVNERTGKVQMHFPTSNVHLIPVDQTREQYYDPPLQIGRIYQVAVHDEDYEDYHRAAEDGASWSLEEDYDDDSMMSEIGIDGDYHRTSSPRRLDHSGCKCPQCTFHRSATVLGPGYYCLTVDDTIYQKVLDEVCASQTMPCGLFFCGHHEDVSRPSIWIPTTIVAFLLTVMAWVAYFY